PIATGETTVAELRDSFCEAVLEIASGKPTRNETNTIGEIVIFKTGVTL
ncbi:MAG: D-galactarate dehydratase / Altronate hydrolase, terminus, partial [Proteobacteria bacterium]|nr:D-galactarate dehydratase / Altronate hydrolase, terminus [Pseudomonadota bacterium]